MMTWYSKSDGSSMADHIKACAAELAALRKASIPLEPGLVKALVAGVALHDAGKLEFTFQRQMIRANKRLEDGEKTRAMDDLKRVFASTARLVDDPRGFFDHEILSIAWLQFLKIQVDGTPLDDRSKDMVGCAVLLHHLNAFYIDASARIGTILSEAYMHAYVKALPSLLPELQAILAGCNLGVTIELDEGAIDSWSRFAAAAGKYGVDTLARFIPRSLARFNADDMQSKDTKDLLLLIGFLRKIDHRGSMNQAVPVGRSEAASAVQECLVGLEKNITAKFPGSWQSRVLASVRGEPPLAIVAPTGSGKSELAFLWAGQFPRKVVYTLPLRVALSDMFHDRLLDGYLNAFAERKRDMVSILHSTIASELVSFDENGHVNRSPADVCHDMKQSKELAYPVMLSTIDQVMLAGLRYYGYEKIMA
ncbi:MAG: hypothetical protein GYA24_03415, partial [Candidatus Lokiarchaeota archaeon]|nr:hypothetical protein [Candidatus Lokiarchaeota archaeon]